MSTFDSHVDALVLACNQQCEPDDEVWSKLPRLDNTSPSSSKWVFAPSRTEQEISECHSSKSSHRQQILCKSVERVHGVQIALGSMETG